MRINSGVIGGFVVGAATVAATVITYWMYVGATAPKLAGDVRFLPHTPSPLYIARYSEFFNMTSQQAFQAHIRQRLPETNDMSGACISAIHGYIAALPYHQLETAIEQRALYVANFRNGGNGTATGLTLLLPPFAVGVATLPGGNKEELSPYGTLSSNGMHRLSLNTDLKPSDSVEVMFWTKEPPSAEAVAKIRVLHDDGETSLMPLMSAPQRWSPARLVALAFAGGVSTTLSLMLLGRRLFRRTQ